MADGWKLTENWYQLLELEFDPNPIVDETLISERIEEKKKIWASKANDYKHGAEYRKYLDYAKKGTITKDMIGEENHRDELIKDACDKVYSPIDKTLKTLSKSKPEISADTVDKMAKKYKVEVAVVKNRISALGLTIVASQGGDYEATYQKYYKTKPNGADKFNGIATMLEAVHAKDLYDFLYNDQAIKNAQNQPCDALRQKAGEKKKVYSKKHDAESGTGSKLCGQCELTFKDDSSKAEYDKYLEYIRRKEILEEAKGVLGALLLILACFLALNKKTF